MKKLARLGKQSAKRVPLVVALSPVRIEEMGVTRRRTVNGDRASTHLAFLEEQSRRRVVGVGAVGWVGGRRGTTHKPNFARCVGSRGSCVARKTWWICWLRTPVVLERVNQSIGTKCGKSAIVSSSARSANRRVSNGRPASSAPRLPRDPFQKNLVPTNQCCQHPHACCRPPLEWVSERKDRPHTSLLRVRRTGQSSDEAKTIQDTKTSR